MKTLFNAVKRCVKAAVSKAGEAVRKVADLVKAPVAVATTGGLMLAGPASAQTAFTIDTSDLVEVITGGVTTISTIGIAVLSLVVVIKLFKWVQRVL